MSSDLRVDGRVADYHVACLRESSAGIALGIKHDGAVVGCPRDALEYRLSLIAADGAGMLQRPDCHGKWVVIDVRNGRRSIFDVSVPPAPVVSIRQVS